MIKKIHYKDGERFDFETHINEFLITREVAQASEAFLVIVKPKLSTHMHKHPDMEQTFYVIRGKGKLWTKDARGKEKPVHSIKTGDVIFMPLHNWHRVESTGTTNLEYMCFNAFPGGFLPGEETSVAHAANVRKEQKKKK